MQEERVRRSAALAILGAVAVALFALSLFHKEGVGIQCAYLVSAQIKAVAEVVAASRVYFPFGLSCTYSVGGQDSVIEQTSWVPLLPLAIGVVLLTASVIVLVRHRKGTDTVRP